MALHQIIYTSCKRGMDGVNDGQQVFSYDSTLPEAQKEEVRFLFSYSQPRLKPGQEMTDEVARTMPRACTYLPFESGNFAMAVGTYLGRDYMGEGGRFGNHMSHILTGSMEDLTIYPCELLGSSFFRTSMTFEEVNSDQKPAYLAQPSLIKGSAVSLESVTEFLSEDEDRIFFLKRMIDALLHGRSEKKRLVICDTTENLMQWFGALNYSLPRQIAEQFGFGTYVPDPSVSHAQICGVLPEGTNYEANSYCNNGSFFVFDFLHQVASPDTYAEDEPFLTLVDTAFAFNFGSLTRFHEFLIKETNYRGTDTALYDGYTLYCILNDGFSDISAERFRAAAAFAGNDGNKRLVSRLCSRILALRESVLTFDFHYQQDLYQFLLQQYLQVDQAMQQEIRKLLVDAIMHLIATPDVTQDVCTSFYDAIDQMARSINLSIPAELIETRSSELNAILNAGNQEWKLLQIVGIFCNYVMDVSLPPERLKTDQNPGHLISATVGAVYKSRGPEAGEETAEKIAGNFERQPRYFVPVIFAMQVTLTRHEAPDRLHERLWSFMESRTLNYRGADEEMMMRALAANGQYPVMYDLYRQRLNKAGSLSEITAQFDYIQRTLFPTFPEYQSLYSATAVEDFLTVIEWIPADSDEIYEQKRTIYHQLLSTCVRLHTRAETVLRILSDILQGESIIKQTRSTEEDVRMASDYLLSTCHVPLRGELLVFYAFRMLDRYERRKDMGDYIAIIQKAEGEPHKVDLRLIADDRERRKVEKEFTEWAADGLPVGNDLADYFDLFTFSQDGRDSFMEEIRKSYSRKDHGEIDPALYADYLQFLQYCGTDRDIEEAGASLSGLKKEALDALDHDLTPRLGKNIELSRLWKSMLNKAESTSSFSHAMSKLGNMFGRFRKD